MASNLKRTITLSLQGDLAGIRSALSWTRSQKDQLEKSGVNVPFEGTTKKLDASLDSIRAQVKSLTDKAATIKFDVNDKKVVAAMANINRQLTSLDGRTANPRISLNGAAKALSDIAAVDLAMDKLGSKNETPNIGGGAGLGTSILGPISEALPDIASPIGLGIGAAILPFIGQALGGGLVTVLGGALAGIGILGASKLKPVQSAFDSLKKNASADLRDIGAPFAPMLESVFSTATSVLARLTPVFTGVMKTLSGPLKTFADTLLKSFDQPAVVTSIDAVAGAFGAILKNLAPSIPGLLREVANAITSIANTIKANPGAFSAFITFLVRIAVYALNTIDFLSRVANYIEGHFSGAVKDIVLVFATAYVGVLQIVQALVDGVLGAFGTILHGAATAFGWLPGIGGKLRAASSAFDDFKASVDGQFSSMINSVENFQNRLNGLHDKYINVTMRGNGQFSVSGYDTTYHYSVTAPSGQVNAYRVKAAASGGHITGPGSSVSDSIPAWLSNGEYVIRASSVAKYGTGLMNAINSGRFARGGLASLGSRMSGWANGFTSSMLGSMEGAMRSTLPGYAGGGPVRPVGPVMAMAGGGGDIHYHVTVNASPLAHPADVGRKVIESIKEFENRSGKSWRSN